ncbi:hypothetical protein B0H16DRAFT_1360860 [Mycena metata]|uniref:Uncharacterized protein n=1 Tax=Mycena metata TaxID=1033252 RepID=A0AAD7NV16_9AGAR|nr:hypothetical protein B0H16DRAFT_1360860 [Mycena metata]
MHRGPSPIFDVPEFPALRRVKPLPKRRRTAGTGSDGDDADGPLAGLGLPFPLPGPDATAEELIAHAESLSAHMALQSYYMPGLQDIFSRTAELANGNGGNLNLGGGYGDADDGEDGDDDGMEHLQQPGNTKKRKVPANASASPGHDTGDPQSGGEDEPSDRGIPTGRTDDAATVDVYQPPSGSPWAGLGIRKGRPPRITLAGLQHKETLKSRKRQLAAVLGALSHGDTLALDQALSASHPFVTPGLESAEPPRVRISRRLGPRLARAARYSEKYRHPDKRAFLECAFTFACPSSTADRLIATKEEVAVLRARFEAELARQAAKAAKLAAANKLMAALPSTTAAKGTKKRGSRTQTRTRTSTTTTSTTTTTAPPKSELDSDLMGVGVKPRGGKKKKRSALANASNPHHLRNYVPSRLPHSDGNNSAANGSAQTNGVSGMGVLGPLPLRFLSADIPPRRVRGKAKKTGAAPPAEGPVLTHPAEEWICAFCEYDLFYGDDSRHRRAVRSRKKILRRRRRARERAARAAGGNSAFKGKEEKPKEEEYEMHPGWAPGVDDLPKQGNAKWRGEPGGGRERAGELGAVG